MASTSILTPAEANNENAVQSKMPWSSSSTTNGFASRQRVQPLSPTQQRQTQGPEYQSNLSGDLEASSLFAGSAPDVEYVLLDGHQQGQQRRTVTDTSRFMHSPTHAGHFSRSRLDPQVQAFNTGKFNASSVFASVREYEVDQAHSLNGHATPNGAMAKYPSPNRYADSRTAVELPTGSMSRFQSISPPYGNVNSRPLTDDRAEQGHSSSNQKFDDAVRSLQALNFEQTRDSAEFMPHRRIATTETQHQHQIHPISILASAHASFPFDYPEGGFQRPPAGQAPSMASRFDPQSLSYFGRSSYGDRGMLSPLAADYQTTFHHPFYSNAGTPPTGPQSIRSTPASGMSSRTSHHEPMIMDRKMTNVELGGFEQNIYPAGSAQHQMNNNFQYEIPRPVHAIRMNPLANAYVGHGSSGMNGFSAAPRVPIREPEQNQVVRSALLEEFRVNSKTNRRFELKDIYNYVVEFSGDQHGSRFIQQKLETANSDEKEQIFKEIQPNLLQLMTDVFGNYVIQKMFEHGNQSQKKVMANQMKGHVMHLSMQMYGCRVVQKAFEYVLTDQQASLVKELEGPNSQILKVVKDQNGNHVVQKAIERIPGEHVQFIVDAHRGQMAKMSTHQYGCRVVQRMLEHCQPKAKRVILDELLEHILPLISDSYGNYVVQHIIQNGEPRDRRQVVNIVLQQLMTFSKHKFASNIVEKSIDCADADQRAEILRGLTAPNEQGVTPVLGLMRDQYGNYVLRKLLTSSHDLGELTSAEKVYSQLHGAELLALEQDMKCNYPVLRRTSYGKQVIAIEKLLFGGNAPSTITTSSGNSALPSTNASSTADGEGAAQKQH